MFCRKMLHIKGRCDNIMAKSVRKARNKEGFYEQICKTCRL